MDFTVIDESAGVGISVRFPEVSDAPRKAWGIFDKFESIVLCRPMRKAYNKFNNYLITTWTCHLTDFQGARTSGFGWG